VWMWWRRMKSWSGVLRNQQVWRLSCDSTFICSAPSQQQANQLLQANQLVHCNFSVHGSLQKFTSAHAQTRGRDSAITSLIVGKKVGAFYCAQSSWFTIRPLCIYLDVTTQDWKYFLMIINKLKI
jgi:hypothetical protein